MTIKEIAQLAGVSISTVSKVMNNKDQGIRPETRERILRLVRKYNYNPYSRNVNFHPKSFSIGVLISSCESTRIFSGILSSATQHGYSVCVIETHNNPDLEFRGILALCAQHPDAVIWEPVNEQNIKNSHHFSKAGIPFYIFNHPDLSPSFFIDYLQLGQRAVSFLISKKHSDIAFIAGKGPFSDAFQKGYIQGLIDSGISYNEQLIFDSVDQTLLYRISENKISGVICYDYQDAKKLYQTLSPLKHSSEIRLPIIALMNILPGSEESPFLTTLPIPFFEFGCHICSSIIADIETGTKASPFVMIPEFSGNLSIKSPFENQRKGLTVIGSINLDHYLKVSALPVSGNAVITSPPSKYPGGKAINQAVGAARLGANVNIIGAVGQNPSTDLILSTLSRHSISTDGLKHYASADTGKAYIFIQPDGNSVISILPGANNLLTEKDILSCENIFKNTDYCLLQTEIPQKILSTAAMLASRHKATTILKPSACSQIDKDLLKYTDILIPNQREISMLCPHNSLTEQADYFLNLGVTTVIVTLGSEGCYLKTKQYEKKFPAVYFDSLDNTGAGDAFISALAVYLQNSYSMEKSIRIATYAAGFCTSREGVVPSLVDKNTLELYIKKKEPDLLT